MFKFSTLVGALVGCAAVVRSASNSSNPAVWTPDPRLHRSLWGIAYTSQDSTYYPQCGDTLEEVIGDVQLMAQLTTRIRLYGTDCQQFQLIQEAIKQTNTNLHVFVGIYLDGNDTTYTRQRDQAFDVLDQYGLDNILGLTVGNEYLLDSNADATTLATATTYLLAKIADTRSVLASKNYNKTIPVGSADAGSMVTLQYAQACDYVMANSHPFFSGATIDAAAQWTAEYVVDQPPMYATQAGKTLYNSEIGWPTDAIAGGDLSANGSIASIPNTQILLDTWVCQANANISSGGTYDHGYFWFELFDEDWTIPLGGAEPYWGLFSDRRVLKNLTIPDCLPVEQPPVGNMGNNTGTGGTTTVSGGGNNGNSGNSSTHHSGAASHGSSSVFTFSVVSAILSFIGGMAIL